MTRGGQDGGYQLLSSGFDAQCLQPVCRQGTLTPSCFLMLCNLKVSLNKIICFSGRILVCSLCRLVRLSAMLSLHQLFPKLLLWKEHHLNLRSGNRLINLKSFIYNFKKEIQKQSWSAEHLLLHSFIVSLCDTSHQLQAHTGGTEHRFIF